MSANQETTSDLSWIHFWVIEEKIPRINRSLGLKYFDQIRQYLEDGDGMAIVQLERELRQDERLHHHVWNFFPTKEKQEIRRLIHEQRHFFQESRVRMEENV